MAKINIFLLEIGYVHLRQKMEILLKNITHQFENENVIFRLKQ
jgi:hypothetical protein